MGVEALVEFLQGGYALIDLAQMGGKVAAHGFAMSPQGAVHVFGYTDDIVPFTQKFLAGAVERARDLILGICEEFLQVALIMQHDLRAVGHLLHLNGANLEQAQQHEQIVIALKTVARYSKLDEQNRAEYFLIGSLASILWAVLATVATVLFDQRFGFRMLGGLTGLFDAPGD